MSPRYAIPPGIVASLVLDALLDRHRSFARDARACIANVRPPVRVLGAEHIPRSGPFVITTNHYYRPGYASQWTALAISACLPGEVHWVMTSELTFPGRRYAPVAAPVSRFILRRIARAYGFTAMPPMPPRPCDVQARAAAVRGLLRFAQRSDMPLVGLAPEGGDQPGGQLSMPPSGAGRLCLHLAALGMRFLPVGVDEIAGALNLNFGEAYELCIDSGSAPREKDHAAAYTVMQHIAALLPAELRGHLRKDPLREES